MDTKNVAYSPQIETFFNSIFSEVDQGGGAGWLGRSSENFVAKSEPSLRKYVAVSFLLILICLAKLGHSVVNASLRASRSAILRED